MLLAAPALRAIHVSAHVSPAQALERVKRDRVLATIRAADAQLKQLGISWASTSRAWMSAGSTRTRVRIRLRSRHETRIGLLGTADSRLPIVAARTRPPRADEGG